MDRLVEMMQNQGNSECQTGIVTTDEECNLETVFKECKSGDTASCSNENAFVRNGLKKGLSVKAGHGVNPFKHGFVRGTDNHNGRRAARRRLEGGASRQDSEPARLDATRSS